jgi:hypothetical protein
LKALAVFNKKHRARIKAKKVARKATVVVQHESIPYDRSPEAAFIWFNHHPSERGCAVGGRAVR